MKKRAPKIDSAADSFERFEYLARRLFGVNKRELEAGIKEDTDRRESVASGRDRSRAPGFMQNLRRFVMEHGAKKTLRCSFCGKNENEVTYLLAGGSSDVHICGGCVDACVAIINKTKASDSPPQPA